MQERFHTFTVLIMKINRSIHKIKTEEMLNFNLKSAHVSCLYYLYKSQSLTSKELCEICEEDKASVSRSIEYLEENGFVKCESTAKKRYKAYLYLTEKGVVVGEHITKRIDSVLNEASEGLTEEERESLYNCLYLIDKNLNKIVKKYGE